ncbi:MAG: hypothetical protein AB7T38_17400 [Nitrospirales bacterium]
MSIPAILLLILLFGLISLSHLIIAKRRGNLPSKVSSVGISLLLSFIILTPLTIVVHRYIPRVLPVGSDTKPFDSAIWKSKASTDWNEGISAREQMLKEVIEKILPGKSRQEIESALGPSIEISYFRELDKDLIYYLGPERDGLFNIDSEWLLIWMDEDGNFRRYMIVND